MRILDRDFLASADDYPIVFPLAEQPADGVKGGSREISDRSSAAKRNPTALGFCISRAGDLSYLEFAPAQIVLGRIGLNGMERRSAAKT
ncbi:hypothetical protein [Mesorhizobium sp. B2-6-4]|uniref:hypothetical protein n=1 Tax=Mesorhizobium sp. B2-6-4 TaxID=2589913 RepID=UPI0032B2679E